MKRSMVNGALLLLAAASGWFTMMAMLYLWGSAKEGYGIGFELLMLVIGLFVTLTLFLISVYLGMKGRAHPMAGVAFLPVAFMAGVLTFWFVIFRPWEREFEFRLDSNPLLHNADGGYEYVTGRAHISIFQPEFWMRAEEAKAGLQAVYNQRAKNDRLIKFSDPKSLKEILGIEERIIVGAFGQPARRFSEDGYDVWIYRPWEDHPDWEMKVFLKDGYLAGIGEVK